MTKTKGDATRARVIEGAIRVLSATGVIGATTRRIAAESGVRLATLHYHFDSKSALLLAVRQIEAEMRSDIDIASGEGLSRQKVAARRRLIEHIDDTLHRPQPIGTSRP